MKRLKGRRGSIIVDSAMGIVIMIAAFGAAADLSVAGLKAMALEHAVDESVRLAVTRSGADESTVSGWVSEHLRASGSGTGGLDVSLQTLTPGTSGHGMANGRGLPGQHLFLSASMEHDFFLIPASIDLKAQSHARIE